VLTFGQGNTRDDIAQTLAQNGNGVAAYIDTLQEARKVLVEEMSSTLMTIARDVKIQVEFNPALVAEYRLIGYENRLLAREDFANDRVDAGDIGAGHEVTALYELTLAGSGAERLPPLRYGGATPAANGALGDELAHLRLRYKRPGEDTSRLIETPVRRSALRSSASESMRFAASVAAYADALRGGSHLESWDWDAITRSARDARGNDPWKLRAEFAELVGAGRRAVEGAPAQVGLVAD
jgi:Ca-activated chloride channel family protein